MEGGGEEEGGKREEEGRGYTTPTVVKTHSYTFFPPVGVTVSRMFLISG